MNFFKKETGFSFHQQVFIKNQESKAISFFLKKIFEKILLTLFVFQIHIFYLCDNLHEINSKYF